jgi:cell volume regulation protein A
MISIGMIFLSIGLADILGILTQIAIILGIGFILKLFSDRTNAPFVVLLILSGTALATISVLHIQKLGVIADTLRMLALIIVVFANGFYLKTQNILKQGSLILTLATFGVILTATIVAFIAHSLLGLALLPALFLGSLLCGTDPAVVASIMNKFPKKIQTILNTESIMNQPLTVILPLIIFDFVVYKPAIVIALPLYMAKLVLLAGVGIVIGLTGFFIGQHILRLAGVELEEIAGLVIALIVYVLAENLGGSGIVAVGITSVLLNSSKAPTKETFTEFNRELALIFTIFVFVMLGMEFPLQMLDVLEVTRFDFIVVIFSVVLARLITILVVTYKSNLAIAERIKLGLIAPKGIGPAALAPLALAMAATSEFISMQAAFTIIKIVYLTIIISALLAIIVARFFDSSTA